MRKRELILTGLISTCILISGCNTDFETISNCVFYAGCLTLNPEKKAEELLDSIEIGEINAASQLIRNNDIRHFGARKVSLILAKKHNDIKSRGGIKSFRPNARILSGKEYVKLRYSIEYNDGSYEKNPLELYRKDGKWQVGFSPAWFD